MASNPKLLLIGWTEDISCLKILKLCRVDRVPDLTRETEFSLPIGHSLHEQARPVEGALHLIA
jgi:hypothetical protein